MQDDDPNITQPIPPETSENTHEEPVAKRPGQTVADGPEDDDLDFIIGSLADLIPLP